MKVKLTLTILIAIPLIILLIGDILPLKEHQYQASDKLSYWFYTPDRIKSIKYNLTYVTFDYNYDIDDQRTLLVMTWKNIEDADAIKKYLTRFLQNTGQVKKYNCAWIYNDPHDYSSHYERYCMYQKLDTFELEYYKIEK